MKKKTFSALFLILTLVVGTTVFGVKNVEAYGYPYSVIVTSGGYRKGSAQVKKQDYTSGAVTPHSGLVGGAYATHRIRFSVGGGLATEYVDVYQNGVTYPLYYYNNMAIKGEYYILATSMDAGQSPSQLTISGLWMP